MQFLLAGVLALGAPVVLDDDPGLEEPGDDGRAGPVRVAAGLGFAGLSAGCATLAATMQVLGLSAAVTAAMGTYDTSLRVAPVAGALGTAGWMMLFSAAPLFAVAFGTAVVGLALLFARDDLDDDEEPSEPGLPERPLPTAEDQLTPVHLHRVQLPPADVPPLP